MDKFDHSIPPHTLRKIHELRRLLIATSITVKLVKIPGHVGIEGNVKADHCAKDTAYRLFKGEVSAPTVLSVQSAFRIAGDIARKSWQRLWDNEHTGRYTYNLIPVVNTKVLFPFDRDIGISYCRLLLHSSMLKDNCYRSGISATPVCVFGADRETSEHFLLHCNIHKKTRIELFEQLHQITASKETYRSATTSEEMLLAPVSEHMSKKQNR